ncbi:iron chelate uptake ABC transporter family permease subunit, partial [Achromobacter xylosoxidans]|uniref:iron chelate uptake ABC transporter family permease subunit n=1 Tax=Alcaligenes xylosoxydans xylosoxydans TaxID=85698 RepID=UPI002368884C
RIHLLDGMQAPWLDLHSTTPDPPAPPPPPPPPGPIAFVGLAVPHIARRYAGPDLRWLLAYCVVLGPLLMLVADILARLLRAPAELLTGVVVAFIGAPFLLAALRKRARSLA